ncbi:putative 7alpha-cephem-methoxylase p8 chain related protein [Podospora aff. communis PSN243]|uniref:7alpha-cephem-methoxylase p8 chain related protein n=1 Tax=Podospora aff. communis PSN243 TaxID=3040156 RepID=A0AAV9H7L7_9PEZI|nr:putative 7alpha-cephem-methoxylase p8 chain related protein [Podospora aff. communis PSN243]
MAITHLPPSGPVTVPLNFFNPPADNSPPFNHVDTPPAGLPQRNFTDTSHPVQITDIRPNPHQFTLDHDAFAAILSVPPSAEQSFTSPDSILQNYYPEVEQLLLNHIPGSTKVVLFDHTIRRADPNASRAPVQRVHIDQTPSSAEKRVRRHLPADEAEKLLKGRYRIVNVWRPLNKNPVESFPLAFASSATLEDEDVVPVEHRYQSGYTGQTAAIKYNPGQKWYYLSGMTGNERLLLECFDSEAAKEGSGVKGGRVAHTAFEDPRTRPDAEGRESIEVRALVFGP